MIINNISIAIVNGKECDVSCLKYNIMLWRIGDLLYVL